MPDDQSTPGPGATGDTTPGEATPAKTVTEQRVAEIVREALGPLTETLQQTASSLGNFREQFKRHLGVAPAEGSGKSKETPAKKAELAEALEQREKEYEALQERMAAMEAENRSAKIGAALQRELGQLQGLAEGASDELRDLVSPHLTLNSDGDVVVDKDGKHHALPDFLKERASKPYYQAPAQRVGVQRSESVAGHGSRGRDGKLTAQEIRDMPADQFAAHARQIMSNKPSRYGD